MSEGKYEYIYFGEYPQTVKADGVTVGSVADTDGYYLGNDGNRYCKVIATPFIDGVKFGNGAAIEGNREYFFKVEPVKWRALADTDGVKLLICDVILANKCFYRELKQRVTEKTIVYPNNYAESDIRKWLNGEFYDRAFSEKEKSLIVTTEVDNGAETTEYFKNRFACENTFDKVFLLSYRDVLNASFGFSGDKVERDEARKRMPTDYAKATGSFVYLDEIYYGNAFWWLRSPHHIADNYARYVCYAGLDYHRGYVNEARVGVCPAMRMASDQSSHGNLPR